MADFWANLRFRICRVTRALFGVVLLFVVFATTNAFADGGYSCPSYKRYTSCASGYYMVASSGSTTFNGTPVAGNACIACSNAGNGCSCSGGTSAPVCTVTVTINKNGASGTFTISSGGTMTSNPSGSNNATLTCVPGATVSISSKPSKGGATFQGFVDSPNDDGGNMNGFTCPSTSSTKYMGWACNAGYSTTTVGTYGGLGPVCTGATASNSCGYTPGGYWSQSSDNCRYACLNTKPSNSIWDSGQTSAACNWRCNTGYSDDGTPSGDRTYSDGATSCQMITRQVVCTSDTGGTSAMNQNIAFNASQVNPSRTGYTFGGATLANPNSNFFISTMMNYASMNGYLALSIDEDGNFYHYDDAVIDEYSGFYFDKVLSNAGYSSSAYTDPVYFDCSWTANTITLDWNENGGGEITSGSCTYDGDLILPAAPTRSGYTFVGWKTADNVIRDPGTVTGGCTSTYIGTGSGTSTSIVAQWCENCASNDTASCALTTSKTGTMCTYATSCNTGYKNLQNSGAPNATCDPIEYSISYNANKPATASGSVTGTTATSTHTYAQSKALTTNGYSLPGWQFSGWNTAANGSGTSYTDGQSVSNLTTTDGETVPLYAQWTANTFTINYANGGGTGTDPQSQTCTYDGNNCSAPSNPYTNNGKTFTVWTCDNCVNATYQSGAVLNTATTVNGATVTMTATWQTNSITLKWQPAYGTAPQDTSCVYGGKFTTPAAPSVTGREFTSWNTNGKQFATSTEYDCNYTNLGVYVGTATFTGPYNATNYTITYVLNGGTNNGSNTAAYTIDSSAITLYNPTRDHSTFQGWYEDSNFSGTQVTSIPSGSTGNRTFYAKWDCATHHHADTNNQNCVLDTFNVTYACGAGTGTPPSVTNPAATYSQTFTTAANTCTRTDWVFNGWLVSGTSDVKAENAGFTWTYTENKTFTAQWIQTACKTNEYLDTAANVCQSCPPDHPYSVAGAESINECYDTCQTSCINPGDGNDCPDNATYCTHKNATVSGIEYYNGTCQTETVCSYSSVICSADLFGGEGYYHNGNLEYYNLNGEKNTNICIKCPPAYPNSVPGSNTNINACFVYNDYNCRQDPDLYKDALAQCSLYSSTITGVVYYPGPINDANTQKFGQSCSWASCTCPDGYNNDTNIAKCDPNTYTITLNDNGGSGGNGTIYETYADGFRLIEGVDPTISDVTIPQLTNYVFMGYYDAQTGGNIVIDEQGRLPSATTFTANTQLYAHWTRGIYTCLAGHAADKTTACADGYYCPGGNVPDGDEADETVGCQRLCPTNSAGGTRESEGTRTDLTDCFSTRTSIALDDGTGGGDLVCNYVGTATNGAYTNCKSIAIKYCNSGHYRAAQDSQTCNKVGRGYWSPAPTSTVLDNVSMVPYPCSALPGYTNATTDGEESALPTACYNTCADIDVLDSSNNKIGVRYANPATVNFSGTITAYDYEHATVTTSGSYPACTYDAPVCNAGYHTVGTTCEANIYTFTLNKNGGTGGTDGPIYMKYNTGWYSDSGATNQIYTIVLPTKEADNCSGYNTANNDPVIGSDGGILVSNTFVNNNTPATPIELTASWDPKQTTTCARGTYYDGTTDKCEQCPVGSWCSGGTAFSGPDSLHANQFITACPPATAGTTYTPAQQLSGTTLVNVATTATSNAGARYESDCYATVQYVATKGKGSQVCHYASDKYASECEANTIQILTCDTGYYLANASDTDCTVAGYQYYSDANTTARNRCPDADTASAYISTDSDTSELVTSCVRTGVWQDTVHGGRTTRCHYNTADSDYTTNCDSYAMRICAAGYYDVLGGVQTSDGAVDCVVAGVGYFSPEQAFYTSEPAKPTETSGTSISRFECPDSGTTANTTASRNTQCYKTCPASIAIEHGTTTVDVANVYYTGSAYPTCTYTATCNTGYSAVNNGTASPSCNAHTYTVHYVANKPATASGTISGTTTNSSHIYDIDKKLTSNSYELTGWTFAGWDTLANGSGTDYANAATVKNLTADDNVIVPLYAKWTAKQYSVTYDCGTGEGTAPVNATATYDSSFTPSGAGECVKTGYSFTGWNDGSANRPAGTAFTWNYTSDKTFVAQWAPNVYEITLDDGADATTNGAPATLYMKYDIGWFTDAETTNAITGLTLLPTKTGYEFVSYNLGANEIIDVTGLFTSNNFTAEDTTINVVWAPGKTECAASYYYSGAGATCALCEENFFCPGGRFTTDSGTPDGLNECPNGGASARGASANTSCYADGLNTYVATYGSGTQTCYYNGTSAYNARCINNVITKCNKGYYYDADSTTAATPDCVAVGQNYYSPADAITRTPCPPTHPFTFGDTTSDIGLCYAECTNATNATQMSGRNYYNPANGVCKISLCQAGYYLKNGECVTCPAGYYCDGTLGGVGDGSTSCAATNANYPLSAVGSDDANDCYLVTTAKNYVANVGAGETSCLEGNYCAGGTTVYVGGNVSGRQTTGGITQCPPNSYCVANVATPTACGTTNANYPLSAAGSDEANDCYLVTTAKNYVATVGAGETSCLEGNYCAGGTTVYVGGTHGASHMTTGGSTTCPANNYCVANVSAPTACGTTNANYPLSAAGSDDANDCYLVTSLKKYVAVTGVGEVDCLAGGYCPGNTTVYVGGNITGRETTGGRTTCPADSYCVAKVDSPTACSTTNANYPLSAVGSNGANDCYLVTTAENYVAITGAGETSCIAGGYCPGGSTIYIGGNVNGRSTIGGRTICPENNYCVAKVSAPTACSTLGTGDAFTEWLYAPAGSDAKDDCYSTCSDRTVTYGHAYPVNENEPDTVLHNVTCPNNQPTLSSGWPETTVNYPARCKFHGVSNTCNPCDEDQLASGTCAEQACFSNYEMINGTCQACNREHATAYEATGNCIVAQCLSGYHPNGDACTDNVVDCTASIPNAAIATSTWNGSSKAFGACMVTSCDDGYHVTSNTCVPDEQTCAVAHGVGIQTWNSQTNKWNACEATSCDAGYTNDPSEKNNQAEQCSECKNKYKENGDLAVSSYVRGCEVASCMYQGEKYALEDGECVPICRTESDETGSRYWDASRHKCVQTCQPGYINW